MSFSGAVVPHGSDPERAGSQVARSVASGVLGVVMAVALVFVVAFVGTLTHRRYDPPTASITLCAFVPGLVIGLIDRRRALLTALVAFLLSCLGLVAVGRGLHVLWLYAYFAGFVAAALLGAHVGSAMRGSGTGRAAALVMLGGALLLPIIAGYSPVPWE